MNPALREWPKGREIKGGGESIMAARANLSATSPDKLVHPSDV